MAYHNLKTEVFDTTRHELTNKYFVFDNECSVENIVDIRMSIIYETKCYENIMGQCVESVYKFLEDVCDGDYKVEELFDIIEERYKYWIMVCKKGGNKYERYRLNLMGKTKIWISEKEAKRYF